MAVTIKTTIANHREDYRCRPTLEIAAADYEMVLTIRVRRRNQVRIKLSDHDLRKLAEQLVALADAHQVAKGDKKAQA